MYQFDIPDMTCGHCASTVRKAIAAADADAVATVDLVARRATVESAIPPETIGAAIEKAGYQARLSAS